MKGIKKLLSYVTKVEYAIMIVAFVAMVTAYFVAVVNRNFIKASMPWTEEVAMYSMIYMALLGTEVGLRDGTQVAVTAIIEKLHGITKKVVSIVEQIVLEIFTAVMLKAGTALFLKQIQTGQTTPVLKIPMSAMYFSLVLTFGLILLIQTVILVEKIMDLKNYSTGVQHIGIPTNDIDKTVEFYHKLGFETAFETVNEEANEKVVFLKLGTLVVETYENHAAKMEHGAIDHVALDVRDIEEIFRYINEAGLNSTQDTIHFLPFWENGVKFFTIEGPNKEKVEFSQYL